MIHDDRLTWRHEKTVVADGVTLSSLLTEGADDGLYFGKTRPGMIREYADLLSSLPTRNVVDLGIYRGGSVAFLLLATDVERLLAVDLEPELPTALVRLIDERGLGSRVRLAGGVDQGDRATLASLVEETFGGDPIDLVIDDASHLYTETRASFELLFPRIRPGGSYVIEDWNWESKARRHFELAGDGTGTGAPLTPYQERAVRSLRERLAPLDLPADHPEHRTPLLRLAMELTMGAAEQSGVIDAVRMRSDWFEVVRGDAPLGTDVRLADVAPDRLGVLGDR